MAKHFALLKALLCPAVGHGFRFRALGSREELESLRSGTEVLVLVLVRQGSPKMDASHVGFLWFLPN